LQESILCGTKNKNCLNQTFSRCMLLSESAE
jgi:hypothetical protein